MQITDVDVDTDQHFTCCLILKITADGVLPLHEAFLARFTRPLRATHLENYLIFSDEISDPVFFQYQVKHFTNGFVLCFYRDLNIERKALRVIREKDISFIPDFTDYFPEGLISRYNSYLLLQILRKH